MDTVLNATHFCWAFCVIIKKLFRYFSGVLGIRLCNDISFHNFMFIRSSFENVKLIVYCLSGMGSPFAVL